MKAKLSFDKAKIKSFFLNHGEKVVFGTFIVVLLLFGYSAVTRGPYERTPADIKMAAQDKDTKLRNASWESFPDKPDVPNYDRELEAAYVKVNAAPFALNSFNRPPYDTKVPRGEPGYLAVLELRGAPGVGGIAYGMAAGGRSGGKGRAGGAGPGGMPGLDGGMPGMPGMPGGEGGTPGMSGMPGGMPGMPGMDGKGAKGKKGNKGKEKGKSGKNSKGGKSNPYGKSGPGGSPYGDGGGPPGGGGSNPYGEGGPANQGSSPYSGGSGAGSDPDAPLGRVGPGADVQGKQWVVITGAFPWLDQYNDYQRTFANAVSSSTGDVPVIEYFEVERAVVTADDAGEPVWTPLDVEEQITDSMKWMGGYPEVVNPLYVGEGLTQPLPYLVGKNFDKSVGHPRIPFANEAAPAADEPQAEGEEGKRQRGLRRRGAGGGMAGMGGGKSGGMPAGYGGAAGGMPGMTGDEGAAGGMGSGMPGASGMGAPGAGGGAGMGMPGMGGGGMGGGMPEGYGGGGMSGGMGMPSARAALVKHRLFRFFDMTVEPGKTYRYRVRLAFVNPNLEVTQRFLADPKLAEGDVRMSEWCAPTDAIGVPRDDHLLAGAVKQGSGNQEPRAELMVVSWNAKTAVNAVSESKDYVRGTTFNFKEKVVLALPDTSTREQEIDFATDLLLVDLAGGENFPGGGKIVKPGEILVMDPDGELTVQSQFTDAGNFFKEEASQKSRTAPRRPGNTDGDDKDKDEKGPSLFGGPGAGAGAGAGAGLGAD